MTAAINYASTPTVGAATLQVGDASRVAPANAQTIFTSPNGGQVERIALIPLGPTTASTVRVFRNDGALNHLVLEAAVPAQSTALGASEAALTLQAVDYPGQFPIIVPTGWTLKATIADTQLAAEASINSIALAQTLGAAALLNLNAPGVTAASAVSVAAAAAPTVNVPMVQTSSPFVNAAPALLSLTSAANVSAVSFKVVGRKADGSIATETIVGPAANTVFSTIAYKTILSITPTATNAGTVSAGVSTVAGATILPMPSPITLQSAGNLAAVNFTITGTDINGVVQSEVLAGPNGGQVNSVKTYASILTIAAGAAVGTNITVGNPPILSGVKAQAEGGGY